MSDMARTTLLNSENTDILVTQAQNSLHTSFNFILPRCRHKQNGPATCEEKLNGEKFITANCSECFSVYNKWTTQTSHAAVDDFSSIGILLGFSLLVDFLNIYKINQISDTVHATLTSSWNEQTRDTFFYRMLCEEMNVIACWIDEHWSHTVPVISPH